MFVTQFVEKFLYFSIREKFLHIVADHFGQMCRNDGGRVNNGVAAERGFLADPGIDPCCRQAECRLLGVEAWQVDLAAIWIHYQQLSDIGFTTPGFDFFHTHDIAICFQLHVVENTNGRHDKAHFRCKLPTQCLDLIGELLTDCVVDQWQQSIANFKTQLVNLERLGDRLVFWCLFFFLFAGDRGSHFFCGGCLALFGDGIGEIAGAP